MASIIFPAIYSNEPYQQWRHSFCADQGRESFRDLWRYMGDHPHMCTPRQYSHCLWGCPVRKTNTSQKTECVPKQPWVHRLRIQGYDPGDIDVKVDGQKIIIHACHEQVEGENMDKYETKRTVHIPENVNKEKISSFLLEGGHLVITAPYTVKEAKTQTENHKREHKIEIQHESETSATPVVFSEKSGDQEAEVTNKCGTEKEQEIQIEREIKQEKSKEAAVNEVEKNNDKNSSGNLSMTDEKEKADEKTSDVKNSALENGDSAGENFSEDNCFRLEDAYVITSPPPSPVQSEDLAKRFIENLIGDLDNKKSEELLMENDKSLPPLMDSKEIVKVDGEKMYQVCMNLKNFKPENVSIKIKDNVLSIDAEKEWNNEGIFTTQKVHRKFMVPEKGNGEEISARMSDDGFVKILVPLGDKTEEDSAEVRKE